MPRPKGSKNKKTILNESRLDERIAAAQQEVKKLESELNRQMKAAEKQQQLLKEKKKELRTANRALAQLREKKAKAEAEAAAVAQKQEIEKVVTSLVSSGKSADEILDMLKE